MTNSTLDRKVRRRAMWCHLSGIFWIVLYCLVFFVLFVTSKLPTSTTNLIFEQGLIILLWISSLFATFPFLMPILFWLINRRLHPFVDQAGKATIKYTRAVFIQFISLMSLTLFISFMTCGVTKSEEATITTFFLLAGIGTAAIVITNITTTIRAAIHASRGEVYKYPFTIE